ncbi:hypothetical protein ROZALSC1DRAFT_31443, partial [Rozella allomycis CSF55]
MLFDWKVLDDQYYHKTFLYHMDWNIDSLQNVHLSVAKNGGPIAVIRNEKNHLGIKNKSLKTDIIIYNMSGRLLHQVQWNDHSKIVSMNWTLLDVLVVVIESGFVHMIDLRNNHDIFSLGKEAKEAGILECKFYKYGLVAMTRDYKFILMEFNSRIPTVYCNTDLFEYPHSWCLIEENHVPDVLIACQERMIRLGLTDKGNITISNKSFGFLCVSSDNNLIAALDMKKMLIVYDMSFNEVMSVEVEYDNFPNQMMWCGSDAVVISWDDYFYLIGPTGNFIKFDRSTKPSALLCDAYENFEKQLGKTDEIIRTILPNLTEAVDECIEAALHDMDVDSQAKLLKSASFGKSYLETYNHSKFVKACQVIRILHNLRNEDVGMFMTFTQYDSCGFGNIIERLIERNLHLMAIKISQFIKHPVDKIVMDWACQKINCNDEDHQVYNTIVSKLSQTPLSGISYSEIAKIAFSKGKVNLAVLLLDHESNLCEQIPLLLSMNKDKLALEKALNSLDADLIYLVIFHAKINNSLSNFLNIINSLPLAGRLLENFYKETDYDLLKDYYYQDDQRWNSAMLLIEESYNCAEVKERIAKLKSALSIIRQDKSISFQTKIINNFIKLLLFQNQIDADFNHASIVGLSLHDTLVKLFEMGLHSRANRLKNDFNVDDKRFQRIKVSYFIKFQKFDELEILLQSKSKNLFIQHGAVNDLMGAKRYDLAFHYSSKLRTPHFAKNILKICIHDP